MKQRDRRAERRRLKAMAWRDRREYILHRRNKRLGVVIVYTMWDDGYSVRFTRDADGRILILDIREGFPPFVRASF